MAVGFHLVVFRSKTSSLLCGFFTVRIGCIHIQHIVVKARYNYFLAHLMAFVLLLKFCEYTVPFTNPIL